MVCEIDFVEVLDYLRTLYRSSLVDFTVVQNCAAGQRVWFPFDGRANGFTVQITGYKPVATIYDPTGAVYPHAVPKVNGSQYSYASYVYQRGGVHSTHAVNPGLWSVKIAGSPGDTDFGPACLLQIRIQSDINLYYGFTQDPHSDIAQPEPSLFKPNYMLAHVTGLANINPAINTTGALEYGVLYNENFVQERAFRFSRRAKCGYEFVSPEVHLSQGPPRHCG